MPSNLSMIDNSFPTFTGKEKPNEQIAQLTNYMRLLVEQLQYQLKNLDTSNWNKKAMKDFQTDTTSDVAEELTKLAKELAGVLLGIAALYLGVPDFPASDPMTAAAAGGASGLAATGLDQVAKQLSKE